MDKSFSMAELDAMKKAGAVVKHHPKHVSVAEIPQLVAEVKRLSESMGGNGTAEALSRLESAVRAIEITSPSVDMQPIAQSMQAVAESIKPRKPAKYTFTVQRDNRGRIETVVAEPDA